MASAEKISAWLPDLKDSDGNSVKDGITLVNGTTDVIDSRTKICYNPPHSPTGRKGGLFLWQDMSGTWTRRSDGRKALGLPYRRRWRILQCCRKFGVVNFGKICYNQNKTHIMVDTRSVCDDSYYNRCNRRHR